MPALLVRRFGALAVAALLVVGLLPAAASPVRAVSPTELFFSEYIEGSSNNKALEIYNGTGAAVNLGTGGYNVQMFFNGSATAGLTINLTGTIAIGDVFVVTNQSASATIQAAADQITTATNWFNGDDAVVLRKGTTAIDVIGQIGFDPGSQWGADLTSTADNTLRRKTSITAGDADGTDAFDPSTQWDGYATDTFDGLGTHMVAPQLVINEVDYDQPGTDAAEFVEILNGGSAAVSLDGWTLELVNGNAGGAVVFDTIALPDVSLAAGDYFVVCANAATVASCDLDDSPDTNFIQNGAPDAVGLRLNGDLMDAVSYEGDTGAPYTEGSGAGLVDDGVGAQGISRCPDGSDTNVNNVDFAPAVITPGAANLCADAAPAVTSTVPANGAIDFLIGGNLSITFSEPVNVTGTWFELTCSVSGSVSATVSGGPTTFTLDPATNLVDGESCALTVLANQVSDQDTDDPPDTMVANVVVSFIPFDVCAASYTPVYAIQGSGSAAATTGVVTTRGVVVGDNEGPSPALRGFYLQDLSGDGDPATSDGIFVFNGNNDDVSLGDVVAVTGTAAEFQDQTQISATSVTACGTGVATPVDVTFPVPSADYLERYEGMLVRLPQTMYVTEHFQLGRFGQVVLSSGARLAQPTNVVDPGADAIALQAQNNLNRIIVDDELQNQNRDPIVFGRGGNPLSASNTLRGGDTATGIVGVMTYTWAGNAASGNAYRVRPINALGGGIPDFQPANPRPTAVPDVGGTVKVAGFNLLNYFNTFTGCTEGVGGKPTDCRGADTAAEFERQHVKTVAALLALDADVVGLTELENDGHGAESALADLVVRLNTATAPGTYALIDPDTATGQVNALGLDAIKVGLIYKPATVTPVGQTAALSTEAFVNGGDIELRNRPALAQAFEENATGARFVAVVNHLKSKGSCPELATDPNADQLDGQSCWNPVRVAAAAELMDWLAGDPTGARDADVILVGDYNAYAMEDPIGVIKDAGYTNLVESFLGLDAYSYVFDGQWGYLDHALGSASLVSQVTGVGDHHINADEPSVLDYNTDFKTANLQAILYAPDEFRTSDHDPVVIGLALTHFDFSGFYSPVDNAPAVNRAKAGQAVAVRFGLGGYQGLEIFSEGFPGSAMVACGSSALADPAATETTGKSSLAYDPTTDTYTYIWKTEKSWAGTCRQLVVQLTDGSIHTAQFQFTR